LNIDQGRKAAPTAAFLPWSIFNRHRWSIFGRPEQPASA
jgi:hypothetical protein